MLSFRQYITEKRGNVPSQQQTTLMALAQRAHQKLTPDEEKAIRSYANDSTQFQNQVNSSIKVSRNDHVVDPEDAPIVTKHLLSAIKKNVLTNDVVVLRGGDFKQDIRQTRGRPEFAKSIGKIVDFPKFLSATVKSSVAADFTPDGSRGVIWILRLPKGTHALPFNNKNIAKDFRHEAEILLAPYCQFEIVSARTLKGLRDAEIEVVLDCVYDGFGEVGPYRGPDWDDEEED